MEATVVSLTRTVLDGVLGIAGTAMAENAALVLGVPREVEFIRCELQMMQSFLREQSSAACSAGGCCKVKDTVTTSVKQMRDLACDLEDCLLDLTMDESSRATWLQWGNGLAARQQVADRIRDLKASLVELNQRHKRYNVFDNDQHKTTPVAAQEKTTPVAAQEKTPPVAAHEKNPAGRRARENPAGRSAGEHRHADGEHHFTPGDEQQDIQRKVELDKLKVLVDTIEGGSVVSVWGMGGMGKSSLVRMLYNDTGLIAGFDGRAWVTVPHPLDSTDDLGSQLRAQLGLGVKRYLVVVDDVSSHEEWDLIRSQCLTAANGIDSRSRVVVTTRRKDVAERCAAPGQGGVYELQFLADDGARKLFCQKVYNNPDHVMTGDMLNEADLILERCRGLPLAIATIGGLLANRPKTSREWMNLREHLGSELESDQAIKRVITSSYDGLPYHLKACFLYLSIFPENHELRLTRLVLRWIAEGYITKPRDMSAEEVGRRYYNELISRSMIQPSEKARARMGVGRCRVNGVVLQIILSKSIEENQLFIMDKNCNDDPRSKIRHLVVTRWESDEEKMASTNLSHVRSLTIIGKCPMSLISSELRLLRVLDLEDTIELKNDDLKHIGELYHLRYLGLRKTKITRLPSSLENLRYLETLDVQDTEVTQLPVGITNLEKLRHLVGGVNFAKDLVVKTRKNNGASRSTGNFFESLADLLSWCCGESQSSSSTCEFSVTAPEGIEKLRSLQVLGVVHITQGNKVAQNLGKLIGLRRLGVDVDANVTKDVHEELCSSVARLARLERLEVRSESLAFLLGNTESPPKHLTSLRLSGHLGSLPTWMNSLNDLAKVKLIQTQLKQVDIDVIGKLPNLTLFALWEESFAEVSLCFSGAKFKKLKLLYIDSLKKVSSITIEEGAMPLLENLQVTKCNQLHDSAEGLSSVLSLKRLNELVLKNCGDKLQLERALQKQISGFGSNRPKLIIGKSMSTVSRS
ncbi:unnamed protein product [Alopecurus aequalis]